MRIPALVILMTFALLFIVEDGNFSKAAPKRSSVSFSGVGDYVRGKLTEITNRESKTFRLEISGSECEVFVAGDKLFRDRSPKQQWSARTCAIEIFLFAARALPTEGATNP